MTSKAIQQISSALICMSLLVLGTQPASAFQDQTATLTTSQPSAASAQPTAAPLTTDQLDALVAPIALYPDALVAQVLGASTFPDQIAIAQYWLAENKTLTGTALVQAVDQQSWDASVKALTQFPSILANIASNLVWTSNLGQAFHDQPADVMAAVQTMRAKAQAAGTLQSTPQIKVVQQSPQTIVIQPANPRVVYVPQYNPTVIYGAPYVVPFYTPPVAVAATTVSFGSGVVIGAAFGGGVGFGGVIGGGGGVGWGFNAWRLNWGGGGGNIVFNNNTYITNNGWHGGYYPGNRPWGPGNPGYRPGTDTHFGPNGAYHPNGYYGPNGHFHRDVPGTNPNDQPNGGHNGDHGLIGGNGGVEHGPNGGRNGDHGLIGGNGGVQNPNAGATHYAAGATPTGGHNGNNGMIGGNGGTQRQLGGNPSQSRTSGNLGGEQRQQNDGFAGRSNSFGNNRPQSRMSGNGWANRAESNRGRQSMRAGGMQRRPNMQRSAMRSPAQHFGGGGRRR
jgi:hypothetical protein